MDHQSHSQIIDRIGGNIAVATLCAVTSQAVSKWRRDGIPPARLMYLRLAKPDAFVESAESCEQKAVA